MTLTRSLPCPDCSKFLATPESLRVHRWLAHGIEEMPVADGSFNRHRKAG